MPNFRAAFALCDGPLSLCGVCFSLYLNKSTSYLSLCLSLNSFCNETLRTWASLAPETRYSGFWLGLSPSHMGSSAKQDFGWIQVPAHRFESFSVVNDFTNADLISQIRAVTFCLSTICYMDWGEPCWYHPVWFISFMSWIPVCFAWFWSLLSARK